MPLEYGDLEPEFHYIELDYTRGDKFRDLDLPEETEPPRIERLEVYPYPDLTKIWIRGQLTYFKRFPNLELALYDPDGALISDMLLVEHRTFYLDLTMHLRSEPRPGERYRLEVRLVRDEDILDRRVHDFDLVFVEP